MELKSVCGVCREKESRLPRDTLVSLLDYNRDTGDFRWKSPRRGVVEGSLAGCLDSRGYRLIKINGKTYFAHRLAILYVSGEWPLYTVDHIDRDPSNNRYDNLRVCSASDNMFNRSPRRKYRGVYFMPNCKTKPFMAQANLNGKKTFIGYFETAEGAAAAFNAEILTHHPERQHIQGYLNDIPKPAEDLS